VDPSSAVVEADPPAITCVRIEIPGSYEPLVRREVPRSMLQTAIYTRHDGIVDWRYCMTRDPKVDFEVPGTHIGMAFNPSAYTIVAERLAMRHS